MEYVKGVLLGGDKKMKKGYCHRKENKKDYLRLTPYPYGNIMHLQNPRRLFPMG
jgi:hypothetical protein